MAYSSNDYYQGPVPKGYDEGYYRVHGTSKPLATVLGASTSSNKSKNTSKNTKNAPSSSKKKKGKSTEDYLKDATKKAKEALKKRYEAAKMKGEQQISDIQSLADLTTQDVDRAIQSYTGQVAGQKEKVWGAVEEGVNKARNTAQDVTRANRNTMRGLGILGSTYAAEKMQAPLSEFSNQRADLYKQGQQQINDLDTLLTNKVGELKSQLAQYSMKFSQMKNDVLSDIRFSDAEKEAAVAQLEQSLADKIASARTAAQNLAQQVAQAKMNISTQLASMMQQANPTANLDSILGQGMNMANNMFDQSGMNAALYGYGNEDEEDPMQLAYMGY